MCFSSGGGRPTAPSNTPLAPPEDTTPTLNIAPTPADKAPAKQQPAAAPQEAAKASSQATTGAGYNSLEVN